MSVNFTDAQKTAIEAAGESILVSAAAGSGKTAVLTARVMRLLTGENPVPADKLIIVTFTVAAAEEMRFRISSALSQKLLDNPDDELISTQQILLQSAKICTIDSLCHAIVSENFHTLGLSNNSTLDDGAKISMIKNEALTEVMEEYYAQKTENFSELYSAFCGKNDTPLRNAVLAIYDYIRAFAFPLDFLDKTEKMYAFESDLQDNPWKDIVGIYADTIFEAVIEGIDSCIALSLESDAVAERYYPVLQAEKDHFEEVYHTFQKRGCYAAKMETERLLSIKPTLRAPSRKPEISELCKQITVYRNKAYHIFDTFKTSILCFTEEDYQNDLAVLRRRIGVLFEIVRKVYAKIDEKKLAQELLDFNDIEHYALELIVKHDGTEFEKTPLGIAFSDEIAEVMVDECQDINDLQNVLFFALSRNGENLFMVGDVKQSIYRFRRASPIIFTQKKKRFLPYGTSQEKKGAYITLEANFRSRKEVCDAVNAVFSRIMTETVGELSYNKEEELVPKAKYPQGEGYRAELCIIEPKEAVLEEASREIEASYLANLVSDYVKNKFPIFEGENSRPCRYEDFCLLFRTKGSINDIYAAAFKAKGIPCVTNVGANLFEAYEVLNLISALKVIDNPLSDVALVGALLSPLFGFTADDVAKMRLLSRNTPLYTALQEYANGNLTAQNAVSFFDEMRAFAAQNSIADLIRRICEETDYIALLNALSDGEQRAANVYMLVNMAASYEKNGRGGLSGFLRYLDRAKDESKIKAAAPQQGTNAVRLMTIHASKGLEFPICILADFDHSFNTNDLKEKYMINDTLGLAMKITDKRVLKEYSDFPLEAVKIKNRLETISEEMRILYVAMTRAKEKIIMSFCPRAGSQKFFENCSSFGGTALLYNIMSATSYAQWVALALQSGAAKWIDTIYASEPEKAEEAVVQCPITAADEDYVLELEKKMNYRYPYERETSIPAKLTVTQIAKAQLDSGELTFKAVPSFLNDKPDAAMRGSILHKFMQFADFSSAKLDVADEINRLVLKNTFSTTEAQSLDVEKIKTFLNSELYAQMEQAELLREYKFNCFITPKEANLDEENLLCDTKIFIQGIADCVIREPDGLTIIDYKTDRVQSGEVLKKRYFDQLRIYKKAIEEIFGEKVKECAVYSLELGRKIIVDC